MEEEMISSMRKKELVVIHSWMPDLTNHVLFKIIIIFVLDTYLVTYFLNTVTYFQLYFISFTLIF